MVYILLLRYTKLQLVYFRDENVHIFSIMFKIVWYGNCLECLLAGSESLQNIFLRGEHIRCSDFIPIVLAKLELCSLEIDFLSVWKINWFVKEWIYMLSLLQFDDLVYTYFYIIYYVEMKHFLNKYTFYCYLSIVQLFL